MGCNCKGGCQCSLTEGDNVTVTGTGTPGDPWVVSAEGGIGSQGPQGFQGGAGAQGAQGFQGGAGAQGAQGTQGVQGSQGTQGAQGAQGAQGSQGTQGVQGSQGAQGFQGTQGSISNVTLAARGPITTKADGSGQTPGTNGYQVINLFNPTPLVISKARVYIVAGGGSNHVAIKVYDSTGATELLTTGSVVTPANGVADISFTGSAVLPAGSYVVAVGTDSNGVNIGSGNDATIGVTKFTGTFPPPSTVTPPGTAVSGQINSQVLSVALW